MRRPKFQVRPPPDGTFSLFFPSRFSLLYLLYLFCCFAVLLFGFSASRLFYFAVHLLSDRVSFVGLHVTRFPAAAPQFTTTLCIPAFSISSIFSGISSSQISFYYRPSIDYFRPAMTEVSSTRLYLGNLPRNGMLAPGRPSSLSFGEHTHHHA